MRSIRNKVLLSGMSVILIFGIVIGSVISLISYQAALKDMESIVTTTAAAYAHTIENEVRLFKMEINNVAKQSVITDPSISQGERVRYLADAAAETKAFDDFSLYGADGKSESGVDISGREHFKQAMNGVTYISSPVIRKTDGSLAIMAGAKVDNGTGYQGVVTGGIDYQAFSKIISTIKISGTGYGYVVDKNGAIIAHPDDQIVTDFATDRELAKQSEAGKAISGFVGNMTNGETGTYTYKFHGDQRFVAYLPIAGEEGWSLAVIVLFKDMLTTFYNQLAAIVVTIVVMMILGAIGCVAIASGLSKPIVAVTRRLEQLSEGDLSSPVTIFKNKDESGILSRALHETIEELKSYISDISQTLGSIAERNLDVSVEADYRGDFEPIKVSLGNIIVSLNETIRQVSESADKVTGGSLLVEINSQNLSQSTTEQAATVEELAATVTSISEQIKISEESARDANIFSNEAGQEVNRSNESMHELLASMREIDHASQEISKIIKVIDDISFQTNILALNAAVEAARAGDSGKGFAVVADEVRNLAQKCADAAKSTDELISTSISAVKKGTKVADDTAAALQAVVAKVQTVEQLMENIARAAGEQAIAVSNINDGMGQIAAVTQNNSAAAEEGAASSEELRGQSEVLKSIVDSFQLQ